MGKKVITTVVTRKSQKEDQTIEEKYQNTKNFPLNGGGYVKISDIRNFYLANKTSTLETIASKFEIPLRDLRVVANSEDWDSSREEIYRRTKTEVQKDMTSQLKELLDVNLSIQQLKTIQTIQTVEYIQQHLAIFGDLWLRDPDNPGQILKDSNGLPRKMPLPRDMKDVQELVKLTQGINSLIGERDAGNDTPLLDGKGQNKEPLMVDIFEVADDDK